MLPLTQVKVMTGVGAVLVVLCSIFIGVFPVIFNSIVDKMLVIREDSETFDAFITPPIPIYMQFWLFNVTNPHDIRYDGAKPVLQEIGPFTYEEVREKYSFQWDSENGTVSYFQNKTYIFREDLSGDLREDDMVTTINVLMVLAAIAFENLTDPVPGIVWSQMEAAMDVFETHAAGDILFYGYDLPDFNFDFSGLAPPFNKLNMTSGWSGSIAEIMEAMGFKDIPELVENNAVGLLLGVNNTNDKRYEVKTGENGMGDFLEIVAWNGSETLHYWKGYEAEYCNMINGTDGSQYPPRMTRDTIVRLYTSELCRSLYLTYDKDVYIHGIPAYRYVPPREVLEDPEVNHDNLCYCVPDRAHCLGAGMLNLQPCLGLPLVLSTPHFYNGDEVELEKIVGLNPSKAEHETTIDVEPRTGVAMYAAKKMQLNIPLKPYGGLPAFKNVPEVIFPIVWVNESAKIDAENAKLVRNAVFVPFVVVDAICGCLIAVGALLLLISGVKFLHIKRSAGQEKL